MAKRQALKELIAMGSQLILNATEDPDAELDEEWMSDILANVSEGAIEALAERRVLEHSHVVEVARLFDYCCVDTVHLLRVMVPGHGYNPVLSEDLVLPIGVSLTAETVAKLKCGHFVMSWDRWDYLDSLVKPNAREWIDWCLTHNPDMGDCLCSLCAKYGHRDLLEWAHRDRGCSWNGLTPATAAQHGHLHIVQWVVAQGCSWDQRTIVNASKHGHRHVAEWARDNNCPYDGAYDDRPSMMVSPFIADFRSFDDQEPYENDDDLGFWGFFFRAFGYQRPRPKRRHPRRIRRRPPVHYPRRSYPPHFVHAPAEH